jgi:pilus assembly protein FimV
MKKSLTPLYLALATAQGALGLGLGDPSQASHLGEPLDTTIPLLDSENWKSDQIRVSVIADSAALARDIDASVATSGGKTYVQLRTTGPVREPYLGFTVELRWPQGTVQRQYQFLLDPPPKH